MLRLGFQTTRDDQLCRLLDQGIRRITRFERADPGGGIQLVLHMCVAVPSAAHEGCTSNYISAGVRSYDLFTTESVLRRNDCTLIEAVPHRSDRIFHLRRLGRDDAKV